MTKQEFVKNYTKAMHLDVLGQPNLNTKVILELIGSLYDQQQMIDYLDNRIIDLERVVYGN